MNQLAVAKVILLSVFLAIGRSGLAAEVSPEFAYRHVTLKVLEASGSVLPGASIYGYCHDLNLVWPRRDREMEGRNDIVWDESFLGKTDTNGCVEAMVPPGYWGFFAVGHSVKNSDVIIVARTNFRERNEGETIQLQATNSRHWILCSATATNLDPKRIFLKAKGFPIWIPAETSSPMQLQMTPGNFQIWAEGEATADHPGFALDWGLLGDEVPDGNIFAQGNAAVIECHGGDGQAILSWVHYPDFGLEGELHLGGTRVLLTPGRYMLAYSRPVAARVTGRFVGRCYNLTEGQPVSLNLEGPLHPGLDQFLSKPDKRGDSKLFAQLYLVDGDGHLLSGLCDAENRPVNFHAAVVLGGERFVARPVTHETKSSDDEAEEETIATNSDKMLFAANVKSLHSAAGAVWEFTSPHNKLVYPSLMNSERATARSATFAVEVPQVILPAAENLLAQADILAGVMNSVAGRTRRVQGTVIHIEPGRRGASALHNGSSIGINSELFFYDLPTRGHTFVHELGHNYAFHHGGLHETVVEVSRCAGNEQISQQPAKWMFLDRMNGIATPEVPPHYPDKGLYLYCYARGGLRFVHFMAANEYAVIGELAKQGYSDDEARTALLSLAMGQDMSGICSNYGLNVTPERVAGAIGLAQGLCHAP